MQTLVAFPYTSDSTPARTLDPATTLLDGPWSTQIGRAPATLDESDVLDHAETVIRLVHPVRVRTAATLATPRRDSRPLSVPTPDQDSDDARIGLVLSNYVIMRRIAQGGMGVVYEAEHRHLQRRAAIKFLQRDFVRDAETERRFLGEAISTARINHPGVVKMIDYGHTDDGVPYLVMELLEGENLSQRLERGALSAREVLDLGEQIAVTMDAAHAAGVVHRDVKPDNVFLTSDDADQGGARAKLLDFGVAKFTHDDNLRSMHTGLGKILGTPLYMSPEQCKGMSDVDSRSDIYGLGCLLYHMACGRAPFLGSVGTVLIAQIHDQPLAPRQIDPTISVALESLILQMMAKDPAERPQTMAEVALILREIASEAAKSKRASTKDFDQQSTAVCAPLPWPQRPRAASWLLRIAVIAAAALML